MIKEVLLELSAKEVERAQYAYREIADLYEEHFDGPRKAAAYREYLIARQMVTLCDIRLAELKHMRHGNGVQD